MWILQNASKLTVRQRRVFVGLVIAFVLTNSQVSAARAADLGTELSATVPTAETGLSVSPVKRSLPVSVGVKRKLAIRSLLSTATAYSSMPQETDDSPYVTASGSCVHDGIVAANFLKIGALIRLPELFGDKLFVVEDRMNVRFTHRIDIWMPSAEMGREFGLKRNVKVEILEEGDGKKHWDEVWTNNECAELNQE